MGIIDEIMQQTQDRMMHLGCPGCMYVERNIPTCSRVIDMEDVYKTCPFRKEKKSEA